MTSVQLCSKHDCSGVLVVATTQIISFIKGRSYDLIRTWHSSFWWGMCEEGDVCRHTCVGQREREVMDENVEQRLVIQLPTQKTSATLTSQAFQLLSWA